MPHPVRQMRLRKQRREQLEENTLSAGAEQNRESTGVQENQPAPVGVVPAVAVDAANKPVDAVPEAIRLHKIMADHGLGSRRRLEDAIREGKVTVNGEVAQIGQTVKAGDKVHFEGRLIELNFSTPTFPRVLIYHKPSGEIVSRDDPEGRADVFERLPKIDQGRWVSVGRLDLNSEGLLLFTDCGELAHRLMHPRHDIEREYAVRVWGSLSGEQCRKLLQGVELEDGIARVMSLKDQGGEGANHWYHVVLKEGRYREVRRIFAALELTVSRLIRVRYANLCMPSTLKRGNLDELSKDQVIRLMRVVGLSANDFSTAEAVADLNSESGSNPQHRDRRTPYRSRPFNQERTGDDRAKRSDHRSHTSPSLHSREERPHRRPDDRNTRSTQYDRPQEARGHSSSRQGSYEPGAGGRGSERPQGDRTGYQGQQQRREGYGPRSAESSSRRPYDDKRAGGSSQERYPQANPAVAGQEDTDPNLKAGGGRHPFKRYSQRRVMSHQREDGEQVVSTVPSHVPHERAERPERTERPRSSYPNQSSAPRNDRDRPPHRQQRSDAPRAPRPPVDATRTARPVDATRTARPATRSQEDEDALLQQRYAEQERRGELRGLAGQTLGQQRQGIDTNGNRRSTYQNDTGHTGRRPGFGGSSFGAGAGGGKRPFSNSGGYSSPSSGYRGAHSSSGAGTNGDRHFRNRPDGLTSAQQPHNSRGRGSAYPRAGDNRHEGEGSNQAPRPFYKKVFKKG
ncbi:MAG: pseudouridine synthase [Pseudomonadota bacterium]